MNIPIYKAYEVKEANPLFPRRKPIAKVIGFSLCLFGAQKNIQAMCTFQLGKPRRQRVPESFILFFWVF